MKIHFIKNSNGPMIGVHNKNIIEQDGLFFRDLEGTGELIPYEDWRLDIDTRVTDLVSRMTIKEMAGLMMYSPHQIVPGVAMGPFHYTYGVEHLICVHIPIPMDTVMILVSD